MFDYWSKFAIVMVCMFAVDACWTYYTLAVQDKKALQSGLWSVGIMLTGSLVTVSYIEDRTYIVAAAIGAFAGTYYTVNRNKVKSS
jgi:hypothetical protein